MIGRGEAYERGIQAIIGRMRQIHERDWSPTPLRREIDSIAEELKRMVALLETRSSAQTQIERLHEEPQPTEIGVDGYPIEEPPNRRGTYKSVILELRHLADSAREAASRLPDPREKRALPFAAMALLHLRYELGYQRPAVSNNNEVVRELDRVCREAGIVLSRERLRGAMADALKNFDPCGTPPGVDAIIRDANSGV